MKILHPEKDSVYWRDNQWQKPQVIYRTESKLHLNIQLF